ncbi:MAG TPA: 2,3-epoxybenzoyl-CoA dihydrolase [Alphaproteobacteria bacterium]|nr:2,3-epoxybenzoyl-CoA dihydrolase [Alphaproteobacteria bacterium]
MISFETHPDRYKHWKLSFEGRLAILAMDVREDGGLKPGYELKLNSYDLGVDIELHDALQRIRFEHPEVGAVLLTSAKERVFCAGANIRMLGLSSHAEKVNFCKFTNETRNGMEDSSAHGGLAFVCAVNGPCAGGGYELALACDHIIMADDGNTSVALPEVPLLAVLPGTGGLTRLVDKRKVRRDRADVFCTVEEGVKGRRALDWRLVDELVPRSRLEAAAQARARALAERSTRPADGKGITLSPLARHIADDRITYPTLRVAIDRERRFAEITALGPAAAPPATVEEIHALGAEFWPLALARALDDAILHLRSNEAEIGTWVLKSEGDGALVEAMDAALAAHRDDWLVREITLFLKRCFKRLDVSSRSLIALIEPGSCFAGTLLELVLAADRSYMLDGSFEGDNRPPARLRLTTMNFAPYPMPNGLSRLASRFLGEPGRLDAARGLIGRELDAQAADAAGLVTFIPDDIDWADEIRLALEERASFSPDALTGMEASLRFGGPETIESKIFGRLSAWQNWIFQRPNAVGESGALKRYGSGQRGEFDKRRV